MLWDIPLILQTIATLHRIGYGLQRALCIVNDPVRKPMASNLNLVFNRQFTDLNHNNVIAL